MTPQITVHNKNTNIFKKYKNLFIRWHLLAIDGSRKRLKLI